MQYYVRGNTKHASEICQAFNELGLKTRDKKCDNPNKIYWGGSEDKHISESAVGSEAERLLRRLEELNACQYLNF